MICFRSEVCVSVVYVVCMCMYGYVVCMWCVCDMYGYGYSMCVWCIWIMVCVSCVLYIQEWYLEKMKMKLQVNLLKYTLFEISLMLNMTLKTDLIERSSQPKKKPCSRTAFFSLWGRHHHVHCHDSRASGWSRCWRCRSNMFGTKSLKAHGLVNCLLLLLLLWNEVNKTSFLLFWCLI